MEDSNHRHQASQQHLALLRQHQQRPQTPGDHNPWATQAALEAHLQQQQALVAIQDLEHQRLQTHLPTQAKCPQGLGVKKLLHQLLIFRRNK